MPRRVSARFTRAAMVAIIALLLAINLVNAVTRGGDFTAYRNGARRLLAGEPLYAESRVAHGFVGPPAQALLFVPFAPLGLVPARLAWFLVNTLLLWYAIATWTRVLLPPRRHVAAAVTSIDVTSPVLAPAAAQALTDRSETDAGWHECATAATEDGDVPATRRTRPARAPRRHSAAGAAAAAARPRPWTSRLATSASRVLSGGRGGGSVRRARQRAATGTPRWLLPAVSLLPLIAVARPLQSQFEHQNLNILLLALAACAAEALCRRRPATAGIPLGIAAAIKIYPALALLWLAGRREWRALGWAALAMVVMTIAPMLIAGLLAGLADLQEWLAIAGAGWPLRRANQSLAALWGRLLLPDALRDGALLTRGSGQPLVLTLVGATALGLATPLTLAILRRAPTPRQLAAELACVNGMALLLSPIAWEHYAVGYYPLFVLLHDRWQTGRSARERRLACATLALGVLGLTLLSRALLGAHAARTVRTLSIPAWTGLLVCLVTTALMATRRDEPTQPT